MVKTYLIDKEYLEKFLNMVKLESVHSIHVTPSEQYNVICIHSPEQSNVYSYAYRILSNRCAPLTEQTTESLRAGMFSSVGHKYVRVYDTGDSITQAEKELLVECFKVLFPDTVCSFLSDRKFTLTTDVV